MPKVRLKPRIFDAVQFRVDNPVTHVGVKSAKDVGIVLRIQFGEDGYFMTVPPPSEGGVSMNVRVDDGDWIMVDEGGLSYPITNEMFEKLYEQVEE